MRFDPLVLSFLVATIAATLALVVGVALGALLAKRFPGRDVLDALLTAPMVLPPTVLGYYVLVMLGAGSALGRAWEDVFGEGIVFHFTGLVALMTACAIVALYIANRLLGGADPHRRDARSDARTRRSET